MKRYHERIARVRSCVLTFCDTSDSRYVLTCAARSECQCQGTAIVGRAVEF
jgi:hypothetical protein